MNKGVLFIISGPSGTGKGTVCSELVKNGDTFLSISATTRDIRIGEEDGVTYYFKTKDDFEKMIADGEMLEWAQYSGNYYGTPRAEVERMLSSGKNVILEIEAQGALLVQSKMPEAVLIFIIPPSITELKSRLKSRGRENDEQIEQRLEAAVWEFEQAYKYDYIVENDNLEKCVEEISAIMKKVNFMRNKLNVLFKEVKERK